MNPSHRSVNVVVNGERVEARERQNLLELLKALRIHVPSPCYHPEAERKVRCRLCLVEVDGELRTSCTESVTDAMVVCTDTPKLSQARKRNLAELTARHYKKEMCANCIWDSGCELHALAAEYGVTLDELAG